MLLNNWNQIGNSHPFFSDSTEAQHERENSKGKHIRIYDKKAVWLHRIVFHVSLGQSKTPRDTFIAGNFFFVKVHLLPDGAYLIPPQAQGIHRPSYILSVPTTTSLINTPILSVSNKMEELLRRKSTTVESELTAPHSHTSRGALQLPKCSPHICDGYWGPAGQSQGQKQVCAAGCQPTLRTKQSRPLPTLSMASIKLMFLVQLVRAIVVMADWPFLFCCWWC